MMFVAIAVVGPRADLAAALGQPFFVASLAALLLTLVSGASAALVLSVPGAERSPGQHVLPVLMAATWTAIWLSAWTTADVPAGRRTAPFHSACAIQIAVCAVAAGWLLFTMVARAAPLRPLLTAAVAGLASMAAGAAVAQVFCPIDDARHQMIGHVLVGLMVAGAGLLAGRLALNIRRRALLAGLLILGTSATPGASAQKATVEVHARAEENGAPVQFALVQLVPAESSPSPSASPPQGMTNADGRYRFDGVAPGRYRVQLLRIGFRPTLSDPVQVAAGETVRIELRAASQPLILPPVTVTADTCVSAQRLKEHPQLQTLWQQARDGASVRTELMARFRYHVLSHEESYELKADGPTAPGTLDQGYVSDPKWAVKNAARNRKQRLSRGYYGPRRDSGDGFYVPSELDVLHEDFLKTHCFVPAAVPGGGEVGLRFRPLRTRRNFLDILGTIWLDSATYLARRLELEYVDFDESRGTVRLDFADVAVAGGTLRMPVRGTFAMRPSRTNSTRRTEGKWTLTYSGFEEVKPR